MSREALISKLFASLEVAVFIGISNRQYELQTEPSEWLADILPAFQKQGDRAEIVGMSPFLDFFLEDACEFWRAAKLSKLESDEWVESLDGERELPLVATAQMIDGQRVLLLKAVGEKYLEKQRVQQSTRDTLLDAEKLEREVRRRTRLVREREEEISLRLVAAAAERDQETGLHVRRIGLISAAMAKEIGWPEQDIDNIRIAAPMHDVGKIGIPDSILLKPGKLDSAEMLIMKKHVQIGAGMLAGTEIPMIEMAREIALRHHERWDGSGYPNGLAGLDIPECARIVSIADVYDALSNKRAYKPAFSEEKTLRMMTEQVGKHFDPRLFEVFMDIMATVLRIKMELSEPDIDNYDLERLTGTA